MIHGTSRFHHMSLAEPPDVPSMGAFSYEATKNTWTQPRGQYHLVLFEHAGCLIHNGVTVPFKPGGLFVLAPGSNITFESFEAGEPTHYFASFIPVDMARDTMAVPIFTQLSLSELTVHRDTFKQTLNRNRDTRTPYLTTVWSLLWAIAKPLSEARIDPYVEAACKLIDERIRDRIFIADLAQELSISHNQLTRKFQDDLGRPPARYVRERRAELAREQLTRTTRPIKEIAASVGVPNLHEFNRLMRHCAGISPRQLRYEKFDPNLFRLDKRTSGK